MSDGFTKDEALKREREEARHEHRCVQCDFLTPDSAIEKLSPCSFQARDSGGSGMFPEQVDLGVGGAEHERLGHASGLGCELPVRGSAVSAEPQAKNSKKAKRVC